MHIAETREQAYRDVEFGIEQWFRYFQKVAAFPQMAVEGGNVREMIDFVNKSGIGAIGTLDDAGAQIERLVKQSRRLRRLCCCWPTSGPTREATQRTYELIAQHVMPRVPGPGAADARRQGARDRRPATGMAEQQNAGRRAHDREVPAGAGGRAQLI